MSEEIEIMDGGVLPSCAAGDAPTGVSGSDARDTASPLVIACREGAAAVRDLAANLVRMQRLEARAVLDHDVPGLRVPAVPKGTREDQGNALNDKLHEPDDVLLLTKQANPVDNGLYTVGEVDENGTAALARFNGWREDTVIPRGTLVRAEDGRVFEAGPHAADIEALTHGLSAIGEAGRDGADAMRELAVNLAGLPIEASFPVAYDPTVAALTPDSLQHGGRIPLHAIIPYTYWQRFRIHPRADGSGTGAPRYAEAMAGMRAKLDKIDEAGR